MKKHANAYKNMFSYKEVIRDLIRGFVKQDWTNELDFDSLERVSDSFVTDDIRDREDDIIWRVRLGPGCLYIYLLIEFQSTVDNTMAIRIMTYIGLLYQLDFGQFRTRSSFRPLHRFAGSLSFFNDFIGYYDTGYISC